MFRINDGWIEYNYVRIARIDESASPTQLANALDQLENLFALANVADVDQHFITAVQQIDLEELPDLAELTLRLENLKTVFGVVD